MDRSRHRRVQHPYPRTARVNALLREILAEELERLADVDERLRMVTLTAVLCEPDLRRATVLLASLPPSVAEALEEHRKALQAHIATEARLRRTPALAFLADPAIEAGERVEAALRRIEELEAAPEDAASPGRPSPSPADDGGASRGGP